MIVQNCIEENYITTEYGFLHGVATSYNYYSVGFGEATPSAYSPGCFDEFLSRPFSIPMIYDHDMSYSLGRCIELKSSPINIRFKAEIFQLKVYQQSTWTFSIGTANYIYYDKITEDGRLIHKADIVEISLVRNGNAANPYAVEDYTTR